MELGEAAVSNSHATISISFSSFEGLRKSNFKTGNSSAHRELKKEKVTSSNSINVTDCFGDRYESRHRRSNNSQVDERLYVKIYDEIISPACSSKVLQRLHEHCVSSSISTSSSIRLVTSCIDSVTSRLSDPILETPDEIEQADTNGSVNLETKLRITDLVLFELEYFEHLLAALCSNRRRLASHQMELVILEIILTTNGLGIHPDIVNMKLTFDDTPIIRATRARDYDVIGLLLRHGADVNQGWLEFQNSLEVLLFSPTQRYVSESDIHTVERCLPLILTAFNGINILRLEQLERNSYFPLHPNWREVLRTAECTAWECSSVPSLKHFCRCAVRGSIQPSSKMIAGINELPLPNILKRYLTLEDTIV